MRIRLTLKARFILVAGGAVAAVALAITAVAFLAIRTDLQNQVRQEVAARADSVLHEALQLPRAHTGRLGAAPLDRRLRQPHLHAGRHVGRPGPGRPRATPTCWRRARPPSRVAGGTEDSFYSFARINDIRAMVLTERVAPGLAIQVAEATTTTDQEVSSIGTMLAALSVVGVLSATLLGLGGGPDRACARSPGWPAWPRRSR